MMRIGFVFSVAMSLAPAIAFPQEQDRSAVASEVTIDEANLDQLFFAFKAFDGKIIRFQGQLYWGGEDRWYLFTESDLAIQLKLDDGRSVTKAAEKCGRVYRRERIEGCAVALDVELDLEKIRGVPYTIAFRGVGFNVEFQ